jgi:hypothetical protein
MIDPADTTAGWARRACHTLRNRVLDRTDRPKPARNLKTANTETLSLPSDDPRRSCPSRCAHIEFLDSEVAAVERPIAQQALSWPEIQRLVTVPGVNVVCAASFTAAVGGHTRFITTSQRSAARQAVSPESRRSPATTEEHLVRPARTSLNC